MKAVVYIRIAQHKRGRDAHFKVDASVKPNIDILLDTQRKPLPTVSFAVALDIPDDAFKQAEQVIAEITIPEDQIEIAAEVKQ